MSGATWHGLAAAERAQRVALADELLAGRDAVVLLGDAATTGPETSPGRVSVTRAIVAGALRELAAEDEAPDALVCLDGPGAAHLGRFAAALRSHADRGVAIVAAMPAAAAATVADALPGAATLRQVAIEVAWLAGAEESRDLALSGVDAPAGAVRWVVFAANVDVAGVQFAEPVAGAVHAAVLERLERANAELARANARLLAEQRPVESAAAAALQGKVVHLEARIAEFEEREQWHAERLALEVEVAAHNDAMFQEARRLLQARDAILATPRHRLAESISFRVRRIPLVGPALRGAWRALLRLRRR